MSGLTHRFEPLVRLLRTANRSFPFGRTVKGFALGLALAVGGAMYGLIGKGGSTRDWGSVVSRNSWLGLVSEQASEV